MKCPHCLNGIHYEDEAEARAPSNDEDSDVGYSVRLGFCPLCCEPIVFMDTGTWEQRTGGYGVVTDIEHSELLYPRTTGRAPLPPEVTDIYRQDYEEAAAVLSISPKASAAISRRLLQHTLRGRFQIPAGNLAREIELFVASPGTPSEVTEAVDAVRQVGNLAAHPTKDQHTGEIVDVEPHEAEWLLDVLDTLFDFAFVQPERARRRKAELEAKLAKIKKKKS